MRLSSRLSDENKQSGEVEAIINLDKYISSIDKNEELEDEEDKTVVSEGDFIEIQVGKIVIPFYSLVCDDSVSFMSPSKLHCLVASTKMISIDCQLTCADYNNQNPKCQSCTPFVQAWFLIESNDIFSDRPIVNVVQKNFAMPFNIKLPVEISDRYSEWLAKAEIAHQARLGAGAAIYLRSIFETLVKEIGEENGIEKTFINKWNKEQYKTFEQYLVSVDSVCQIIPEQYSANGYDLFRRLSNIAHGNSDEDTALREYEALKCLVTGIIDNVKRKRAEIKNNQEIQNALIKMGFAKRGENDE